MWYRYWNSIRINDIRELNISFLFIAQKYKTSRRMVAQIDANNTEIARFPTLTDAANVVGVSISAISNCCKGKSLYSGMTRDGVKLKWMYYEDYLKNT